MIAAARTWLAPEPGGDSLDDGHTSAYRWFNLVAVLVIATYTIAAATSSDGGLPLQIWAVWTPAMLAGPASFIALRLGRVRLSATMLVMGMTVTYSALVALLGLTLFAPILRWSAPLMALAALMLGRRALWLCFAGVALGIVLGHLRDLGYLGPFETGDPFTPIMGDLAQAGMILFLFVLVLDRFGAALRSTLAQALAHESDLKRAVDQLSEESERRAAVEATMVEAHRMEAIGRLSGGIAHEFNNLLTTITGHLDLARLSLPPAHPAQGDLAELTGTIERANLLPRQLLVFAGRDMSTPERLWLEGRIGTLEPLLRRLVGDTVTITTGLDQTWPVVIDPAQLDQLLVNLAVNARDAMLGGGTLTIRTEAMTVQDGPAGARGLPPGDYVVLEVSDTGHGIDATSMPHVFEPFFTTKSDEGTGLGLATCQRIVEGVGGAIVVDSVVGEGAVFRVYLPRAEGNAAATVERAAGRASTGQGERILVAEDDTRIRSLVGRILSSQGYEVLLAGSAAEALHLAAAEPERPVDLLLTDVVMPGESGRVLADRMLRARPGLPVILMTGYNDEMTARHGVPQGGFDVLMKPFSPEQLAARVRAALDARDRQEAGPE